MEKNVKRLEVLLDENVSERLKQIWQEVVKDDTESSSCLKRNIFNDSFKEAILVTVSEAASKIFTPLDKCGACQACVEFDHCPMEFVPKLYETILPFLEDFGKESLYD